MQPRHHGSVSGRKVKAPGAARQGSSPHYADPSMVVEAADSAGKGRGSGGSRRGPKNRNRTSPPQDAVPSSTVSAHGQPQRIRADGHQQAAPYGRFDPSTGIIVSPNVRPTRRPHSTTTSTGMTTTAASTSGGGGGAGASPAGSSALQRPSPSVLTSSANAAGGPLASSSATTGAGTGHTLMIRPHHAPHGHGGGGGTPTVRTTSPQQQGQTLAQQQQPPPLSSSSSALRERIQPTSSAAAKSSGGVTSPSSTAHPIAAAMAASEVREPLERPSYALSLEIMAVYKSINVRFCTETRRKLPGSSHYNDGYDDSEGHYLPIIGEEIAGRYTVQDVLGKGSFGTVLRCCDEKYQLPVAVKIVRRGTYFENQGRLEAEIVAYLNQLPSLESLVVQLRKVLLWKDHVVLVFELLSFDLFQLIRCTKCNGVSLDLTRKFALQLLKVFSQLERHEPPIIHCDLKPENVLLRDPSRSGIRVIDFGSACYQRQDVDKMPYAQVRRRLRALADAHQGRLPLDALCTVAPQATVYTVMPKYVQSRFYRSPEVILELGYTSAIDRWSLACMLVELHTGVPLFPGRNEADMLALFTAVLGPLPVHMIIASPKRSVFYNLTPLRTASGVPRGATSHDGEAAGEVRTPASPSALSAVKTMAAVAGAHVEGSGCGSPPVSSVDGGASQATSFIGGVGIANHGSPLFTTAASLHASDGSAIAASPNSTAMTGAASSHVMTCAGWAVPHGERRRGGGGDAAASLPTVPTAGLYYATDAQLQLWSGPQDHNRAALASLKETLGVYSGGPRGCRREQKGHEPAAYECFLDFILKLLAYDPRERMTCAQALEHPFLHPLLELEAAAQRQQQEQQR